MKSKTPSRYLPSSRLPATTESLHDGGSSPGEGTRVLMGVFVPDDRHDASLLTKLKVPRWVMPSSGLSEASVRGEVPSERRLRTRASGGRAWCWKLYVARSVVPEWKLAGETRRHACLALTGSSHPPAGGLTLTTGLAKFAAPRRRGLALKLLGIVAEWAGEWGVPRPGRLPSCTLAGRVVGLEGWWGSRVVVVKTKVADDLRLPRRLLKEVSGVVLPPWTTPDTPREVEGDESLLLTKAPEEPRRPWKLKVARTLRVRPASRMARRSRCSASGDLPPGRVKDEQEERGRGGVLEEEVVVEEVVFSLNSDTRYFSEEGG